MAGLCEGCNEPSGSLKAIYPHSQFSQLKFYQRHQDSIPDRIFVEKVIVEHIFCSSSYHSLLYTVTKLGMIFCQRVAFLAIVASRLERLHTFYLSTNANVEWKRQCTAKLHTVLNHRLTALSDSVSMDYLMHCAFIMTKKSKEASR
ncbi:hypothetical protein ANN_06370 [Periplaneta americana]|uniref:Uncharacterized protein n=1 Tax=Periplaneta americana TaxID=6978 RepID=A0ABQ8TFE0_PERAM|nr:hypothetical protein ANN_06370 [Periplaneta americana]